MVIRKTLSGATYHEPPYSKSEEADLGGGPVTVVRGYPVRSPKELK